MATAADSLWRKLDGGLAVHRTQPHHAAQLEQLQAVVFPTLSDAERFKAAHYLRHRDQFAQGQFVVTDGDRVVGMTSTVRMDFDFGHADHTFAAIIGGGWLSCHQPTGAWLYGADIGTHPAYRGRGIARALYAARHETVAQLGLRGQLTVGMLSGLGAVKATVDAHRYYAELVKGARSDPTLSAQLRIGFQPKGLIANYINDPVCDGYGVLLVLPAEHSVPIVRNP